MTAALQRLLDEPAFTAAVESLADVFKKYDAAANFLAFVDNLLGPPSTLGVGQTGFA